MTGKYEHIFGGIVSGYGIEVERRFKSAVGRADIEGRKIFIPKELDTYEKFMVSLHEVGHIVNDRLSPRYYEEYMAEKYAFGVSTRVLGHVKGCYENRARAYVYLWVCKGLAKGLKLAKVNSEVIRFITEFYNWEAFVNNVQVCNLNPVLRYNNGQGVEMLWFDDFGSLRKIEKLN